MHNAQTFATYSFGFATYLNVVDSEVIPNNSKRLLYFHENHTATLHSGSFSAVSCNPSEASEQSSDNDVSAILVCKVTLFI